MKRIKKILSVTSLSWFTLLSSSQLLHAENVPLFSQEQYESMIQEVKQSCRHVSLTLYSELVDLKTDSLVFNQTPHRFDNSFVMDYSNISLKYVYPITKTEYSDAQCFLTQSEIVKTILLKRFEERSENFWNVKEVAHLVTSLYYESYYAKEELNKQKANEKAETILVQTFFDKKYADMVEMQKLGLANLFFEISLMSPPKFSDIWLQKSQKILSTIPKDLCSKAITINPSNSFLYFGLKNYACKNELVTMDYQTVFDKLSAVQKHQKSIRVTQP